MFLGDARHLCSNFLVGLWLFVAAISLWISRNPDDHQSSFTEVKALNTAYASGSIVDWGQLYSLLGTMSTKGQLRGKPPKPRAGTSTLTPGVSGDLAGSVHAATGDREFMDYSSMPDKTAFFSRRGFQSHEKMFGS